MDHNIDNIDLEDVGQVSAKLSFLLPDLSCLCAKRPGITFNSTLKGKKSAAKDEEEKSRTQPRFPQ